MTAVHSATDDSSPCRREWDPIVPVRDTSPVSSPDVVALLRQLRLPKDELARIPSTEMREPGMVCFSCGRTGHGVSRCSCMDTAFPFLPPGWSVDFRDGQYREVWPTDRPGRLPSGNAG